MRKKISNGKGSLIICDTKENLLFEEELYKPGEYKNTFYPLVNVLKKTRDSGGSEFSKSILNFIGEDEYIMRINSGNMYCVRWMKNDA